MRSLCQKDGGAGPGTFRPPDGSNGRKDDMERRGRVLAIEGSSGAGKTTVVRAAARAFGWQPLPEAFDRLDPPPSLRFQTPEELLSLERTLLAEEERRYREAVEARARGRTVVADTGFLGPLTYTAGLVALGDAAPPVLQALRSLAEGRERSHRIGLPDGIVYLDVPARVRRRRTARDPRGHPTEFQARHEAVGRLERRFYRRLARGALAGRVRFVSGTGAPETVASRVRVAFRSLETRRGAPPTLRGALALLGNGAGRPPTHRSRPSAATVMKPARSCRPPR
jgi:thymidylate kinase